METMTAAAAAEMAAGLNAKLADGGVVQVATMMNSTIYRRGSCSFEARGRDLFIVRGKRAECLTSAGMLLCSIRTGRFQAAA